MYLMTVLHFYESTIEFKIYKKKRSLIYGFEEMLLLKFSKNHMKRI